MEKLYTGFNKQVLVLIIFVFFAGYIFSTSIFAETIKLLDGTIAEGRVVEDTAEYIRIVDTAGYIHKYPYSDIEEVSIGEEKLEFSDTQELSENEDQSPDVQVDSVMSGLEDNLKKTEHMIQDTLSRLYKLPSDSKFQEPSRKTKTDRLEEERDNKYRKNKKYY
jgi:hypothetical protein